MPYVNPGPEKNDGDLSTTMSSTLPMAAVRLLLNLISTRSIYLLSSRCSRETSIDPLLIT